MGEVDWNDLEVGHLAFKEVVEFWRDKYDWRSNGFDDLDIHFLHHKSTQPGAIPLIFIHGWPGSLLESLKLNPLLTEPADGRQAFHTIDIRRTECH
ncbi:unnamed protein product [Penicillium salamii]|uniref:Epoxide hydrolase N-terminal domain-containing protein n=1 Tax=Penicillium salamii TaxID=1612424 RepID=A0A9W4NVB2_9EURO|nr:unnamed protein product [Penicillium salamii]CAG8101054.1 unnamed protein product [Penicillium salamii]CAG8172362.1 unnamed protein product [Penicillium salamii]CAG8219693.1 unnamed protein product [Penicillium salamii]CAG8227222.1 unnamed protein product [Penicillium salamii]